MWGEGSDAYIPCPFLSWRASLLNRLHRGNGGWGQANNCWDVDVAGVFTGDNSLSRGLIGGQVGYWVPKRHFAAKQRVGRSPASAQLHPQPRRGSVKLQSDDV